MPKRVLTRIHLTKIAAVDDPCQTHATATIIKRRTQPDAPALALAKATFTEALNGAMVADKVNEAFWSSFDGLWARNDAFRCALTDELAEGGDGSQASADYIASVDALVETAVTAARSAGAQASDAEIEKAITDAVTSWIENQPQSEEQDMPKFTTKAALKTAAAGFAIAKSTVAEMNDIVESAVALDAIDELPANQPELVAAAKAKKDAPMPDAEEGKKVKKLEREVAILKLAPDAQTFVATLDEPGQDAFIGKSAADQAADIAKANSADPVLHKCKDGTEIRKSDGVAALMMAKRLDKQDEEIALLKSDNSGSAIEKRATASYPHVALKVATDLLKSAAQVGEDTDAGKAVIASLDAMNKVGKGAFRALGSTDGGGAGEPGDLQKARQDYDTEVGRVMTADKIGMADAMSKVRVARPDLFKAAYPDTAELDAEDAD